ncbi:MAG: PAS domain S-box protein [Chloroflexi bacterium]|nr:PAS domain S-box protein [Chloroflexota bacterium]
MPTALRVLILEDSPADAELMLYELRRGGFDPDWRRAETEPEYRAALDPALDLILADCNLPQFDGLQAHDILLERGLDIPFIIVSGSISEELAVSAMQHGVADYVVKDRLARLGPAVTKALEQRRLRDEKRRADQELQESEDRYRDLVEHSQDLICTHALDGQILSVNPWAARALGYEMNTLLQMNIRDILASEVRDGFDEYLAELRTRGKATGRMKVHTRTGETRIWEYNNTLRTEGVPAPIVRGMARDVTEQLRAEAALRESEARFRALVEQSLTGVALIREGQFVYVNPRLAEMVGYRPDEMIGLSPVDLVVEADRELVRENLRKRLSGEVMSAHYAFRAQRKDGTEIEMEVWGSAMTYQGRPAVLSTLLDITERKRAEEALSSERNLLRTLIDNTPDFIFVKDTESQFVVNNTAHMRGLKAASQEELLGKTDFDIFPHELAAQYYADEQAVVHSGQPLLNREEPFVDETGQPRWLLTSKIPLRDGAGAVVGLVGISRDITERKRAEEALTAERALLRIVIDNLPHQIYVKDTESRFLLANAAAAFTTGAATVADLIGKTDFDFFPQELAAQYFADEQEIIRSGQPIVDHEEPIVVQTTGEPRWNLITKVPLRDSAGKIIGLVGLNRDITDYRRRERELEAIAIVANALRTAPTRAEMLPILLDQTLALAEADGALLAMRDPVTGETVIELGRAGLDRANGRRIPPGEGLAGYAIATGRPYVTNDVRNEPRAYWPDLLGDSRAVATVPLIAQGEIIGALMVAHNSLRAEITGDEVRLLTAIGDMAANAIRRATLHEQTERSLERLAALRAIDNAISSSLDLRVTLNIFLDQVTVQLRVDAAAVLLLNPHTQILEYAAGRGFRSAAIAQSRLRLGEGHAGRAALERRTIVVGNLPEAESDRLLAPILAGEHFIAYFGAPLIAKGQIKGVLEIFHRVSLTPDPEWLDFLKTLGGQAAIAIDNAQLFDEVQRSNIQLTLAYDATIEGWSRALDLRDQETEGHTQRVTEMTLKLARAMGIGEAELVHIRRGALLHDIGKMGIPDRILFKNGPLTDGEWAVMRDHPVFAYQMLLPIAYLRPALDIPYCHHEKWDGTGYPRGLKGDTIPLAARIFAVADVWDALRSDRPYREAWPEEKVREYLRQQAGKHFDPNVAQAFLKIVGGE